MSAGIRAWVRGRAPAPPEPLLEWVPDAPLEGGYEVRDLVAAGLGALEQAQRRAGRDREAAFRLLAADALLTYACEAATEGADVEGALAEVLTSVTAPLS